MAFGIYSSSTPNRMVFDVSLCKPLEYYLDLKDFIQVNEQLNLPTSLISLVNSQISIYNRNCMMFHENIELILTQHSIVV
jgi:hypothetical protein